MNNNKYKNGIFIFESFFIDNNENFCIFDFLKRLGMDLAAAALYCLFLCLAAAGIVWYLGMTPIVFLSGSRCFL